MSEDKFINLMKVIYNDLDNYKMLNDKITLLYSLNKEYNKEKIYDIPKYLEKVVTTPKEELLIKIKKEYNIYSNLLKSFCLRNEIDEKYLIAHLSLINLMIESWSYEEFNKEINNCELKIKTLRKALKIDNILNNY